MPFKVQGCAVTDAGALARNNMSAYWSDTTWRLSFDPDRPLNDIIAAATARSPSTLLSDRPHKRHQKLVDGDSGAVMGYARWILPDRLAGNEAWLEAQVPDVDSAQKVRFDEQAASVRWTREQTNSGLGMPLERIMRRLTKDREYIELEYLAVHPDYSGRGVASELVRSGLAAAEDLGVDVIVMAYKAAVGVYTRLGFETIETLEQDDTPYGGQGKFIVSFMIRPSQKQAISDQKV